MANGISIPIKVDGAAQFKRDISSATAELKNMRSALKLVEQENKGVANTADSLKKKLDAQEKVYESNKKKIDALDKVLGSYKKAQDEAAKAVEKAAKEHGEESKEYKDAEKKLQSLTTSVNKYESQLNDARTAQDQYGREISETKDQLDVAEQSQDKINHTLDDTGKALDDAKDSGDKMIASFSKMEAIEKVAGVMSDAFGRLGDVLAECDEKADAFETSMAKIKTIAATDVDLGDMEKDIKAMSLQFGQSAEELGESVYQAISASVDTEDATGFVEDATKLAIGGFTDTTTAVDVLTTAINAYGKETEDAAHISDVLIKTQKLGKTQVGQLGASMGQVIPTAAALGVDLENLSTGYVILTRNGVDTASATTYLSSMFTELGRDGTTVSDILKDKTGKSFGELMREGYDVADVLGILSDAVGGNAEAFSNLWSNVRAGRAGNTLLADLGDYKTILDEVTLSAGATEEAFETMASTGEMTEARLEAAKDGLKMAIGEALSPVEDKKNQLLTDFLTTLTEQFEELPDSAKTAIAVVAEIGTTAGKAVPQVMSIASEIATLRIATKLFSDTGKTATTNTSNFVTAIKKLGPAAAMAGAAIATIGVLYGQYKNSYDDATANTKAFSEAVEYNAEQQDERHDQIQDLIKQDNKYIKGEKRINDLLQARTATEETLAAAQENQAAAARRRADLEAELEQKFPELAKKIGENGIWNALGDPVGNALLGASFGGEYNGLVESIRLAKEAEETASATAAQAAADLDTINAALKEAGIEYGSWATVVTSADAEVIESMKFSIEQAGLEALAFSQLSSEQQLQAQSVVAAYDFMKEAIANAVDMSLASFGELGDDASITVSEMITSIQGEVARLEQWETDLATLLQMGVSPDIVSAFATAGTESQAYVDALLAATPEDIAELNSAYAEKLDLASGANDAGEDLITAFTEIEAGGKEALEALAESLNTSAFDAGGNVNKGMIEGIRTAIEDVEDAGMEVGEASIDGLKEGAGENSPSIYAKQAGTYVDSGMVLGIEGGLPRVKNSAARIGQTVITALTGAGAAGVAQQVGAQITQNLAGGLSAGSPASIAAHIMAQIAGALAGSGAEVRAYRTGAAISQGVAAGINDYSAVAINAAVQMAERTLRQVQARLKIHSPSQVFAEEVGAMIPAGIAEGANAAMDINVDRMAERFNRSINSVGRISSVNQVYVYIGDKELTTMLTAGVVKQINGGIRAYSASQGR